MDSPQFLLCLEPIDLGRSDGSTTLNPKLVCQLFNLLGFLADDCHLDRSGSSNEFGILFHEIIPFGFEGPNRSELECASLKAARYDEAFSLRCTCCLLSGPSIRIDERGWWLWRIELCQISLRITYPNGSGADSPRRIPFRADVPRKAGAYLGDRGESARCRNGDLIGKTLPGDAHVT